ncbi:protein abrupt-like isoform X2 [Palaemon carinicauda]|uniref:protein abrupt-like isoform X2 n=1 Tax=Palaemon carinicauda TaxID=392227 RepID=UPI0035B68126
MDSPGTSYYLLRWSDHVSNYAEMFLTLREQEEFVDCSIACEDGIVGAHRLVLAGCSSYMRDLLKHSNNPHPIIFLLDISRSTVLLLMEFIYRGQAHIPHSRLGQLVKLGKALKIKGLSQVFLPGRREPPSPQIPRLHGVPDSVCEAVDVSDKPNESTHLNGNTPGSPSSSLLHSEKDFTAGESNQKDMNSKEVSNGSRNEIHNLSRNKENAHIANTSAPESCESDSDKSDEERLTGRNNINVTQMKNSKSRNSSNTVCSENTNLNQASASPKASYTPKPKSKKVTQEKNPKPNSESRMEEKTQNSPMPKNKKNIVDQSASSVSVKKQLEFDKSGTPSKAKKSVESNHSSPSKRDALSSAKKRSRESSESSEAREASPIDKKKKSSKDQPKVKPPVYKANKLVTQKKMTMYSKKAKVDLATYALKNGLEASKRYALTKYGVKIRSKSLEKLISLYGGVAKMKMKGLNNPSTSGVEFVKTMRGGEKLLFEGYAYNVDRIRESKTYWRCTNRMSNCNASITTIDHMISRPPPKHSHPPTPIGKQVLKVKKK